jgi:hypothetical protein
MFTLICLYRPRWIYLHVSSWEVPISATLNARFSIVRPLDRISNGELVAVGIINTLRRKFVLKKIMNSVTLDSVYSLADKFCFVKFEALMAMTVKYYFRSCDTNSMVTVKTSNLKFLYLTAQDICWHFI